MCNALLFTKSFQLTLPRSFDPEAEHNEIRTCPISDHLRLRVPDHLTMKDFWCWRA